jgi:hypothetical protein
MRQGITGHPREIFFNPQGAFQKIKSIKMQSDRLMADAWSGGGFRWPAGKIACFFSRFS